MLSGSGRRRLWRVLLILLVLGISGLVYLCRPLTHDDLYSAADPAESYEEAMERFAALQDAESRLPLHDGGRSVVLTHGHPTDQVFVLLHGLTNSPRQFRELGEALFAAGANVVIPRLAHHGLADRMTEALGSLTAPDLIRYGEYGLDIAQGLGRHITVVGLSVSGATAAWMAQNREDVDEVFLLAPFFAPGVVPDRLTPPLTSALVRLPNTFMWWDPRVRENTRGPPTNYPRFSTRALGESLRLGLDTADHEGPLTVRRLGVILSDNDLAVNNNRTRRMVAQWQEASPDTEFLFHTFPAEQRIPHDFIDPLQPDANPELVNGLLLALLLRSDPAPSAPVSAEP